MNRIIFIIFFLGFNNVFAQISPPSEPQSALQPSVESYLKDIEINQKEKEAEEKTKSEDPPSEVKASESQNPEVISSESQPTKVKAEDAKASQIEGVEVNAPEVKALQKESPEVKVPETKTSKVEATTAEAQNPEVQLPVIPVTQVPNLIPLKEESHTKINGVFGFNLNLFKLPSSKEGQTAFSLETLRIDLTHQLDSEISFKAGMKLASQRDASSGEMLSLLDHGFVEYRNENDSSWIGQIGMVLDPLIQFERKWISSYILGKEHSSLWERYSYFHVADQGANLNFEGDSYSIGASLTNGEGLKSAEQGAQKELTLYLAYGALKPQDDGFYILLGSHTGKYELLPVNKSTKDRQVLAIGYHSLSGIQLLLQGVMAQDAIDGINLQLAEGANLLSRSGEIAQAKGGSIHAELPIYNWENFLGVKKSFSFIAKAEQFDPDDKIENNEINSNSLGIGYSTSDNLKFSIFLKNTIYKPKFSPGTDDRSAVVFSTQAQF